MPAALLSRKQTHFVLWRPGQTDPTPRLYIGRLQPHSSDPFANFREIPLSQSAHPDCWEVLAKDCGLIEGQVYSYWFKVRDASPYSNTPQILYCTDPVAWTVDRQVFAPIPPEPQGAESGDPASVVLYQNGRLVPCDPDGQTADWAEDSAWMSLPANARLVIYELPTRWSQTGSDGSIAVGTGTFRDALALLKLEEGSPSFSTVTPLSDRAHLVELGVNGLELLPPADSDDKFEWGYGTANYFAADFDLGRPDDQSVPTASTDLVNLIQACHQAGLRFFYDIVMAFARNNPYHNVNFSDFFVQYGSGDPEQGNRDGFGGDLLKYNFWVDGYHPITGEQAHFVPAREYMKAHLAHWMEYYRIDGLRLDSINNVANWDFVQEFKDFARSLWEKRGGRSDRFLVVGEELSLPLDLVHQQRLDGLWNDKFKQILRQVILGQAAEKSSFESSVRNLIDCRNLGFTDGTQAVNYLTSHDVGIYGSERLYNYLENNGVVDKAKRIKLAFVCLLTAVGIPMILAGEEFADQQDLGQDDRNKQVDPVNYNRLSQPWRQNLFNYVARLVKFRTTSDALAVNDTQFIHVDFEAGKRVLVWQRGQGESLVVVVANFSAYATTADSAHPAAEYVVPNWPATLVGKQWQEITQQRVVPSEWVYREPIFPWEAKVYALI